MKITFNLLLLFTQKKTQRIKTTFTLFSVSAHYFLMILTNIRRATSIKSQFKSSFDRCHINKRIIFRNKIIDTTHFLHTNRTKNAFYYDLFGWREKKKFSGTFLLEMLSNETWIFDLWEFFMITKSFWEIFEEFRWVQMVWIEVF